MTKPKDEAWTQFMVAFAKVARVRKAVDEKAMCDAVRAYAQAHSDAALADTLGLLEALAKRDEGDDSREIPWAEFGRGTRSPSVAVSGYQEGLRYFRVDEDGTEHPISRDDALALLAGEEKKECP